MKRFSTIFFMIQILWCSVLLAKESVAVKAAIPMPSVQTAGKPKVESLKGKDVVVRLYKWQADPPPFEKISVQLAGDLIRLDFNDISDSIVVVLREDQKDTAVAEALGDRIYARLYRKGLRFSLSQASRPSICWTFTDALSNPVAGATVEIFLCMTSHSDPRGCLRKLSTDEKGQLKVPILQNSLGWFNLVVSHPEYGLALVEHYYLKALRIILPLVRIGTKADERCIWGTVADPEGNSVSGASIGCSMAYTLGGGPIYSLVRPYKVITDEWGAFCMYLPNKKDARHNDRGDLIPPKSKYEVKIEPPRGLGLLPYEGQMENGQHTTIALERAGYFHTFAFEDENGPIIDHEQLKKITLLIKRENKPELRIGYNDWKDGGMFPLGMYKATIEIKWMEVHEPKIWIPFRKYRFDPLEVTADSPELLVLKSPGKLLCCGYVVDGVTGKPMYGAFVVAKSSIYTTRNLCQITPEQWQMLDALPANPSADNRNLSPLREIYVFDEIVRTNENGRFEINFQPSGQYYELVVFERNYLAVKRKVLESKYTVNHHIELPVTELFPSAKVTIGAVAQNRSPVIEASWSVNKEEYPAWANGLLSIEDDPEICFAHRQWNKSVQTLPVPCELNIRIHVQAKWDRRWCPLTLDQPIYLMQGQTLDLGQLTLQPMVKVAVIIVDSMGEPVEGVPVKRIADGCLASPVYNTNEDGIAWLNVPPYSRGSFYVSYCGRGEGSGIRLKEELPYQVMGEQDNGSKFILALSDEILYHLFR
jgi:hypothetical protein